MPGEIGKREGKTKVSADHSFLNLSTTFDWAMSTLTSSISRVLKEHLMVNVI